MNAAWKQSRRGGVLIYALVIVALSSLLLTGWIELMIVRGNQVNQMEQAVKRRIALANSTAMFRQYLLTMVLPGTTVDSLDPIEAGSGWGGVSILTSWVGSPFASSSPVLQFNPFNPGGGGGYVLPISALLQHGTSWIAVDGQVQTRSPVTSGSLLTSQTPRSPSLTAISITGGLFSSRGARLWRPSGPNNYNFGTAWFATPENGSVQTALPNAGGTARPPSNLTWPPIFTTNYTGSLDVVDNPSRPFNSWTAQIQALSPLVLDGDVESEHGTPDEEDHYPIASDGAGNIRIALDQTSDANFVIHNVETLELTAAPVVPDDILRILIQQTPSSTRIPSQISFTGSNTRPVLLGIKTSSSPTVEIQFPAAAGAVCQLWATVENTPLVLTSGSGAYWVGGLRSDRSVDASGADLTFQLPSEISVESSLDRQGWVEIYQR